MKIEVMTLDSLNDGWNDVSDQPGSLHDRREISLHCGDTVLYQAGAESHAPAVLVAPADGGGWLARGARWLQPLIYLNPERIVLRLPQNDLR